MTGAAPAQSVGPMVFVDSLERPVLADDDRHHLERVLRLRDGDAIVVADGRGAWRTARLGDEIEPTGELVRVEPPPYEVAVGFVLVKGDRPELVCQKLTELGVDRIVPMTSDHGVVRWDGAKAERQRARLEAVGRAAAMQCRRTRLPVVEVLTPFADVVASLGTGAATTARADMDGAPAWPGLRMLLVGPEGGWSSAERDLAPVAVRLADHVLRAETAAIVAATVLCGLRGGHVGAAAGSAEN